MSTAIRDRIVELRRVRAGDLVPHLRNWRKHPEGQRTAVTAALREIGYADALLARQTEDGRLQLIDGHLRRDLTPDQEVPVLVVDLTEDEALKLLVTLDPLAGLAETDLPALQGLLEEIDFELPELREVATDVLESVARPLVEVEQDDVPPVPDVAETQPGDLYVMGEHRLLCGDSTDPEQVARLMDGQRAALFATDPPYLVDYDGTNHPNRGAGKTATRNKDWSATYHDWDSSKQGSELYTGFLKVAVDVAISEDAAWYCWHASSRQEMVEAAWVGAGAFVHQQIIWVKTRGVLTHSDYLWRHEPCFFGWLRGHRPRHRRLESNPTTVWEVPSSEVESKDHPTPKPVTVFAIPMEMHTSAGDLCYEPFSGSGTQFIAAEQLGRRCFGLEREPRYCDVIISRWSKLTGKAPERQRP